MVDAEDAAKLAEEMEKQRIVQAEQRKMESSGMVHEILRREIEEGCDCFSLML